MQNVKDLGGIIIFKCFNSKLIMGYMLLVVTIKVIIYFHSLLLDSGFLC